MRKEERVEKLQRLLSKVQYVVDEVGEADFEGVISGELAAESVATSMRLERLIGQALARLMGVHGAYDRGDWE